MTSYLVNFRILVGSGAQKYAITKGLECINLISDKKLKKWSEKKKKKETTDTIGSIMIIKNEELGCATMIIATSSGGPWLKMPGRMGSVRLNSIFML